MTDPRTAGEVLRPALELWLIVTGMLGGAWVLSAHLSPHLREDSLFPLVLGELVYGAVVLVIVRFARRDPTGCRVFAPLRRGMLEACLLFGIVGSMLLAMWETAIPWSGWGSPIAEEHAAGWPLWACLLMSSVLPGIFEELMYRGIVFQRLRAVVSLRLALLVQAMLFSLMHTDPVYLLPHFVFGCVAGVLRLAAHALWPCMLIHMLWNAWIALHQYDWL